MLFLWGGSLHLHQRSDSSQRLERAGTRIIRDIDYNEPARYLLPGCLVFVRSQPKIVQPLILVEAVPRAPLQAVQRYAGVDRILGDQLRENTTTTSP